MSPEQSDVWSRWLLQLRNGGDAAFEEAVRTEVEGMADRVLDGANLRPGMTLCDIGTGDGLVAFRAIDRIGLTVQVVLTDISAPLLRRARERATERGVMAQCTFLQCSADKLSGIADGSVDAVTTRSALAYVMDKKAALAEFLRILKPGGRLSLVEPILQDEAYNACALRNLVEAATRVDDPFLPLVHRWKAAQFPDTLEKIAATAITNFSERTLFESIRICGFTKLHLELHMDLRPSILPTWKIFLESSPHPLAPTLAAIMADRFSAQEREVFENRMRPLVESGQALSVGRDRLSHGRKAHGVTVFVDPPRPRARSI